jgi:uncharacterized coiled-coil DUF342 family protein
MALSAASIAAIKETRKSLAGQIEKLAATKDEHQKAIDSINERLTVLRAQKTALAADLPEVKD